MLTHLAIKDFVIVRSLAVDLTEGLTVLTGETGAGKSILLDAVELILGGRADAGFVRTGCTQADLTGIFEVKESLVAQLVDDALIADADDPTLIIRRVIDAKGKSRAWVNGQVVSITQLKTLGEKLLDIHGQHAHQSLLKPAAQLTLLDEYGHYPEALADTQAAYRTWVTQKRLLTEAQENAQKSADEAERLAWVVDELKAIAPVEGEWDEINFEHKRLANAHDILETLDAASLELTDNEENAVGILARQAACIATLGDFDPKLADIAEQLIQAQTLAQDAAHELERYRDRTDLDESRFEEVDTRVSLYFNAARKFHVLPEDLHVKLTQAQEKLDKLQQTLDLESLAANEAEAKAAYEKAAKVLTRARYAAAKTLSEKVSASLNEQAMPGAVFAVSLPASEPTALGLEKCEFLVAAHAGTEPRPLTKVASGGELSRISLAIAVITARATPVDTLIFDEVDAGIGGATAQVVGRLLRTLARDRQVMCVTHVPQVACFGHSHWFVSKSQTENETESHLTVLSEEQRPREIARMLGGQTITEKTLANAQELLEQADL